ncbi:hypothetical protein ALT1000_260032 [Alteromonas macleodii]
MLSQWPPVTPRLGPATNMRGPTTSPALMASLNATSAKPGAPTLRTVVKPASNVALACLTPVIAARGSDTSKRLYPCRVASLVKCTCISINPGISVALPKSIRVASFGTVRSLRRPDAVIILSFTITAACLTTFPLATSIMRSAVITVVSAKTAVEQTMAVIEKVSSFFEKRETQFTSISLISTH